MFKLHELLNRNGCFGPIPHGTPEARFPSHGGCFPAQSQKTTGGICQRIEATPDAPRLPGCDIPQERREVGLHEQAVRGAQIRQAMEAGRCQPQLDPTLWQQAQLLAARAQDVIEASALNRRIFK